MNQLSVKNMCGGRSKKNTKKQQTKNKPITNQKLHVSELLPLAASYPLGERSP